MSAATTTADGGTYQDAVSALHAARDATRLARAGCDSARRALERAEACLASALEKEAEAALAVADVEQAAYALRHPAAAEGGGR